MFQKTHNIKYIKNSKLIANVYKDKPFNKSNSLKDIECSLKSFKVTEYFLRIFELTNQGRGRENSKFKNAPTLDQIIVDF